MMTILMIMTVLICFDDVLISLAAGVQLVRVPVQRPLQVLRRVLQVDLELWVLDSRQTRNSTLADSSCCAGHANPADGY